MTKKDTVGKYVCKYSNGTETVILKEDGSFYHSFEYENKKLENNGTWYFEYKILEVRFIMRDWIEYIDPFTLQIDTSNSKMVVNTFCDGESIMRNPDIYEYNLQRVK
jgi:hypothetical protein